MFGCKYNISLIVVLVSLLSARAFSQQINFSDSLARYNSPKENLKTKLNFSLGSTFIIVPHIGTVTGFTLSPSLSIPLSPKLSVDGGIIAGRFYPALGSFNPEGALNGAFNEISVYGSASYHFNSQLTVYGAGIKQLAGTSPYSLLPKSSYTIGSAYNFGNFSIGVSMQMSKWNDIHSPFQFNDAQGLYPPYDLRPAH
jgi:hypothetical protein